MDARRKRFQPEPPEAAVGPQPRCTFLRASSRQEQAPTRSSAEGNGSQPLGTSSRPCGCHAVRGVLGTYLPGLDRPCYSVSTATRSWRGVSPPTMHMGYSAKAIANFFINRYGRNGISPLKLQKLVYIAHGWNLALRDEVLVNDEYPEAWKYGPVFPSVYYEFRDFGRQPVDRLATDLDDNFEIITPKVNKEDEKTSRLLNKIWEVYGKYSGTKLSQLTHNDGSPWHAAWEESGGVRNAHIEEDKIKDHYRKKMSDR